MFSNKKADLIPRCCQWQPMTFNLSSAHMSYMAGAGDTGTINSLWPNDAIWWQRSGSTLAQAMACCPMAPSHYLNHSWLPSVRSIGIHLSTILQEILPIITKIIWKITFLKFLWNLLGANELSDKPSYHNILWSLKAVRNVSFALRYYGHIYSITAEAHVNFR